MLAESYYSFKNILDSQGVIFSYSGFLSERALTGLGNAVRQKMRVDDTDIGTITKVFSVFVEQVQNIIRYSQNKRDRNGMPNSDLSSGVITIGKDGGRFFVIGGNLVLLEDVPSLKNRLDRLQEMSKDALKAEYKEKLKQNTVDASQNASIGLIEIARRSTGPIVFDFKLVDSRCAFFCLKAFV